MSDCLATLKTLLLGYRSPKYEHMPAYVRPGWLWNSTDEQSPAEVVSFEDGKNDFLLAAFWPAGESTQFGLFPLGFGEARLSGMPMIGEWKVRDPSLSSMGVYAAGKITLRSPRVTDGYFVDIVTAAGVDATEENVRAVGEKVGEMLLIKAFQFISAQDQRAFDRFSESHQYGGGPLTPFCQSVLDDLAAWDPGLLPYIQDLPMRIRALLLEEGAVNRVLGGARVA